MIIQYLRGILIFTLISTLSACGGGSSTPKEDDLIPETPAKDTTAPVISLNGEAAITVMMDGSYNDLGATASDNKDGDITSNIQITGIDLVDTSQVGTYTISYNVVDAAGNSASSVSRTVEVIEKWSLVWSDEFNESTVDPAKWAYMFGNGTLYGETAGWGNNELQSYTDNTENTGIYQDDAGNSALYIDARETADGTGYTSAKLTTEDLFEFRFGRVDARIKVPGTKGMWPAFWTLGANKPDIGWPGSGEIDIMEVIGNQENMLHGTVHYVNTYNSYDFKGGTKAITEGKYSDEYHVYSVEWTPEKISWLVDDVVYNSVDIEADMKEFLREHYLILNVAVGGNWPGNPDETTVFPGRMSVDYVRVYQDNSLTPSDPPALVEEEETMGLAGTEALAAIKSSFAPFQNVKIVTYGPSSPEVVQSTTAIDGATSISAAFPGGNWGGMYFELTPPIDAANYENGYLVAMLSVPEIYADVEIKLEGTTGAGSLNLVDYTPETLGDVFSEYRIPLADFLAVGTTFADLKVPFALWNAKDADGNFVSGTILVDNIHFVEAE
jgi:beta-glucanase (GH16 family)